MLKAESRLKKQAEFSKVLGSGKRYRGQFLNITSIAEGKNFKLGIIVTKKVAKKAVTRNRLRRIVSHIFEHILHDTPTLKGEAVVIITRLPQDESYKYLEADIKKWLDAFLLA